MKKETLGELVSKIIPGNWLLMSKLGKWYEKNLYHKFKKGDILITKKELACGYTEKEVFVIDNYVNDYYNIREGGMYITTMYTTPLVNAWNTKTRVINGERINVNHNCPQFKWNTEYRLEKVDVGSVEEALEICEIRRKMSSAMNKLNEIFPAKNSCVTSAKGMKDISYIVNDLNKLERMNNDFIMKAIKQYNRKSREMESIVNDVNSLERINDNFIVKAFKLYNMRKKEIKSFDELNKLRKTAPSQ